LEWVDILPVGTDKQHGKVRILLSENMLQDQPTLKTVIEINIGTIFEIRQIHAAPIRVTAKYR
jgi:hypothetical protein